LTATNAGSDATSSAVRPALAWGDDDYHSHTDKCQQIAHSALRPLIIQKGYPRAQPRLPNATRETLTVD